MKKQLESAYILSSEVVQLAQATPRIKTRLCLALRASLQDIEDWLTENSPYNKLTNVRAVDVLQQETHLPPNKILVLATPQYIQRAGRSKRYPLMAE